MTREDLKNYKYNQEWIRGRLEYIEEYRSIVEKTTSTLSDMPGGSKKVQDSMAEKIVELLDAINELLIKVNVYSKKQNEILEQLEKVEQPYRLLLEKAYIQGKTLVTVASEMNYSYEHMKHMNGVALNKFDEVLKLTPNLTE